MGHWFQKPLCVPKSMDVHVPLVWSSCPWIQGLTVQFSSVRRSVVSDSFWLHGLQHARPPCPSPTPRAYSNSCNRVSDAIQSSHPLSSSSLPAFNLSQHQGLSNESVLHIRWPKYRNFSFTISPSNVYSRLISFRMDWLDLLAVQGTLKSLLQHHNSKAPIFQCSAFFIVQLSHPYMTTGKIIALTRWTFVGKVMSLLFNMLSRLLIAYLPRSKHLPISWLPSPSAVTWKPKTIKSVTGSIVSHLYLPWSDGTGCHDVSFLNVEF